MQFADFIPRRGQVELRSELWSLFQEFDRYLRDSVGYNLVIQRVDECPFGQGYFYWHPAYRIEIPFDKDDRGVLFHEGTHDLFHHSVFHHNYRAVNAFPEGQGRDPRYNEAWGEGFCEAVRWLMESAYLKDSNWLRNWKREVKVDSCKQLGQRILNFGECSLSGFANTWKFLVADFDGTSDYLNRHMPL